MTFLLENILPLPACPGMNATLKNITSESEYIMKKLKSIFTKGFIIYLVVLLGVVIGVMLIAELYSNFPLPSAIIATLCAWLFFAIASIGMRTVIVPSINDLDSDDPRKRAAGSGLLYGAKGNILGQKGRSLEGLTTPAEQYV